MKFKTLAILIVLALLLGGWAWWTAQQKFAAPPTVIGTRVLPPFPINEVGKIVILSPGTNFTVAKTQGTWKVASRFNYPAKFGKVVESLQELDNLTVGQALPVAFFQLGTFNLLLPPTNAAPDPTGQAGTLLGSHRCGGGLCRDGSTGRWLGRRKGRRQPVAGVREPRLVGHALEVQEIGRA